MKKLGLISASVALLLVAAVASYAADNMQLHGDYGYSFSGSFGTGLTGQIVETGVLSADGNGNIKATAKAVINGAVEQDAMYECTYEVGAALAIAFDCVRTANGAKATANFCLLDVASGIGWVLDLPRSRIQGCAWPATPSLCSTWSAIPSSQPAIRQAAARSGGQGWPLGHRGSGA